jgi:hypothetical protein
MMFVHCKNGVASCLWRNVEVSLSEVFFSFSSNNQELDPCAETRKPCLMDQNPRYQEVADGKGC